MVTFLAVLALQAVAIQGVTVIDGRSGPPLTDATVVIDGDRIAAVGPRREVPIPAGARVESGRGRWLIPGLIDMHAHVTLGPVHRTATSMVMDLDPTTIDPSLRALLAFGVTTIRDPGAVTPFAVAVRDSIERGQRIGPRIRTAGEVIEAQEFAGLTVAVRTEAEARAEVRRQAAAGVDYIKVYVSLPPPVIAAAIDEAHRLGKKVIGHLFATSWTEAADLGIDAIVHAVPSSPRLLRPAARDAWRRQMTRTSRFMIQWFEFADLASPEIDSMVTALIRRRVVHDPTLVVFEAMTFGNRASVTESPDLRLAPPQLLANWRKDFQLSAGWTAQDFDSAQAAWPRVLQFVKHLHDRGVLITVGTDANNPWVPPGSSFHRELELLVQAGLSPTEVLRAATRNGAVGLDLLDQVGTIEPGKRADLVLLTADPLADIRNTRRIAWVMRNGRRFDPATLLAAGSPPGR